MKLEARGNHNRALNAVETATRILESIPASLWLFGTTLLLVGILYAFHRIVGYSSDDVSQQVLVWGWVHGQHSVTWLTIDSNILKVPVYVLLDTILAPSRRTLFVEMALFTLANLFLFWYGAKYFIVRFAKHSLSFFGELTLWAFTLSFLLLDFLTRLNTRNVELGASFLLVAMAARYLESQAKLTAKALLVVTPVAAGLGLFLFSDQYFAYNAVLPLALLVCIRLVSDRQPRQGILVGTLVGALLFSKLWGVMVTFANVRLSVQPVEFATLEGVVSNSKLFIESFLSVFHADFFGLAPLSISAFIALFNLGLVAVLIRFAWRQGFKLNTPKQFWQSFFILQSTITALTFILSNSAVNIYSGRYLVLIPFDAVILGCFLYEDLRAQHRVLLTAGFAVAILLNLMSLGAHLYHIRPVANEENIAITNELSTLGLTKGYSDYWQANIDTYLSKGAADVVPLECAGDHFIVYHWLMDEAQVAKPATKSFLLWSKGLPITTCPASDVSTQFGRPSQAIPIDDQTTLFIYDYDLASKLK